MRLFLASAVVLSLGIALAQVRGRQPRVGDNGPATKAEINDPEAIALDGSKTLYIVELDGAIRRVDLKSGIITTVQIKTPRELIGGLAVDSFGHLIATESELDRLCRIDPVSGSVTTIAGGKEHAFSGDGGPAIDAGLDLPDFVITDAANNVYFVDIQNNRVRRIDGKTGIITTVAGSGKQDSSGDGGPALEAGLEHPTSVAVDRAGNLFISQSGNEHDNNRIRQVAANTGIITAVAAGLTGDRGPALSAGLRHPSHLLFDRMENLYVVDNDQVHRIDANMQSIKTIAGSTRGFGGDGGPATQARLDDISSIAMDSDGNLYIAELGNHRIRRVDARTGIIHTVAGNGLPNHIHSVQ